MCCRVSLQRDMLALLYDITLTVTKQLTKLYPLDFSCTQLFIAATFFLFLFHVRNETLLLFPAR